MSLVRGLALVNDVAVLRRLYGDAMVAQFATALTAAQRAELEAGFLPGRWYDEDIQARLCQWVCGQLGREGGFRLGVAIGHYHVNRAQRFLARVAGPRRLLDRAAGLWRWWRDTGRMEVELFDRKGRATVVVREHPLLATPGYAEVYGGSSAFLVALSGARNVRLRIEEASPARVVADVRWAPDRADGEGYFHVDAALASLP